MTRTTTLFGYALIAGAMLAYALVGGRVRRGATIGDALAAISRWRLGRWLLQAGWLWLGWHLFVRSDVG